MADDGRHEDLAKAEAEGAVPRLAVRPPGPRSQELLARQQRVAWSGALDTMPIGIRRKHGSVIEDVDGNLLIDMLTGWGSTNIGATHPEVLAAAIDALRDYGQEIPDYISAPFVVELAEKLVQIAPDPLARVSFEISGTEAVESAMKFMRARTERPFILTFLGQYHGESYGAQAVGSQASRYSRFMRELNNGYVHVPYPHPYRCPFHARPQDCDGVCVVDYVREQILPYLMAPDRIAGVMIEPVAGEAGVFIPPDPFWPALMELCREHGWLWCADEAQTLFGRCGPMFATELWDLHPDLMVLAKALSGGILPIAACLGSEDVMGETEVYAGGAYPWFPPSCAAALKGIEVLEGGDLLEHGRTLEAIALDRLVPLADRYEIVGEARVKGLYIGVEFVRDRDTKEKAVQEARAVHFKCLERGIVGIYDRGMHVVRWQPALSMPEAMFERACDILEESIAEVDADR
ncbi:MAG TPA: aminotransferase class III-fold pyridoxal phosphate-dependent enzyme [Coriobacteriia bacterium]